MEYNNDEYGNCKITKLHCFPHFPYVYIQMNVYNVYEHSYYH